MGLSLIDKLTNYLMPLEEVATVGSGVSEMDAARARKSMNLHVHTNESLKVVVASPVTYDDVCIYANHLKENVAVVINFAGVDLDMQHAIKDFMNGVCYVVSGNVQRIADSVFIYVPGHVDIEKELYAYSVPAYIKPKI
ncbi:cell division protein SepF [Pelosinus propionicus]|uniref:Cell division protein SepF n=1 Tax=Pelosinus propionicus DSM 13327 TaxID=1123291 RepID=A0A1I4MVA1_9FIRM|nr:cell division protein SepF [Pelosinus propionicus]SFM07211.1 cell division inhibitor SepF [Pelosinus propionicus DSM 13327]